MAEQLTGTVIAEKYRVDSLLRSGELGNFYRGRHLFMDKPVTLKVLPPALALDEHIRDLFTAEAKSSSALAHPNILAVTDFGANRDESYYIVFEGFDGEPLSHAITRGGQFSTDRAISISRYIAEALNAAHENGFIHGNLTPDSILGSYSPTGETVKVFDFKPICDRQADAGSPINVAYLAPEQFSGLTNLDGRADIYSLGIILYQMLAGEVPFKGETPTDVMLKHAEEPPAAINTFRKDVPASLEAAVQKALAKDPAERYQTAGELIAELDKAATESSKAGNTLWKTAFAAVAGIAVLSVALIYATYTKQTIPTTQLQPDANGVPVQPINPASGTEEQALMSIPAGMTPGEFSNSNMSQPPGTLPGGDNYNPWAAGAPPPGGPLPTYVPPGGTVYQIDPNTGSPFMPNDGTVILVPVPANTNTAAKPTPTPKVPAANTNVTAAPSTKPAPELKGTPVKEPAAPVKQPAQPKKPGDESPAKSLS